MSGYITKKKDMRFQSVEALQQVVNVVNEAAAALDDPKRTIRESAIPEVLAGAFGAGIGGAASFAALYGLGTVGLSAAGITSGLATAGEKERLYQEVLKKHQAIIKAQRAELNASKERQEYLESLNILLSQAIRDLKHDLGYAT